ncbi:putative phage abortive infection protein [Stutzerimonas kunmingensis]|uniref:putative phage abortive infection protein n=1 Tax=Stutzerimonas stutzeri group TaxID=136846 RepID=UPI0022DD9CAA|nr:putative phage abortive infection protein [Stutzerimonas frequens]MDA0426640.1 putative phage abortive infection protein [Stutzerimonas frequens]
MKKILEAVFILVLAGAIVLTWATYPKWIGGIFAMSSDESSGGVPGAFGDSFGVLNTLFSGLAFFGIIVSILMQSKELKETRGEIKTQGEQFKIQAEALTKQVFENTFFQLLNLHNEITLSISVRSSLSSFSSSKVELSGRAAFKSLYENKFGQHEFIYELGLNDSNLPDNTNEYYLMFHEVYGSQLGHYFRNIYQILKYVDQASIDNKKFYTNLLRAQLSSYELVLLFFNCLSDLGVEKFKPLLEKYEFFEHLPYLDYMSEEEVRAYSKAAYGSTNEELINIHEGLSQNV